ncbi:MAG: Uma2 family endonuclease [Cryomorphaceae bacterium]|jgi:Uma2 family endonuclease
MSRIQKVVLPIGIQEYLDGELVSDVRHEYIDGEVYAMSGGTRNHNRIAGNIFSLLDGKLEGGPCKPFINDINVRMQTLENDAFYYPDVVVTCDPEDDHELYVEKPSLIVEVLSDSTHRIDKNEKFFAYRSLESLNEYVIVSQKKKEVIIARKTNQWKPEILTSDDFELHLTCLAEPIPSSRIYRDEKF